MYFRFLYDGGITEYEDDSEYAPSGCVSFMTIHQSKGMEFPIVIVDSLNGTPKSSSNSVIEEIENKYFHREVFETRDDINLDREFEEYCTCDDYYQPVVEDFEIEYYLKEWCKKNGFKLISCEGEGDDSGFEPDSARRWIKY